MPFGGNDWLALTPEPTVEPEIPICDPHHHFWDFRPQSIPYQRYLLHELAADINSGHNVRSTVFVEARAMYRSEGPERLTPTGGGLATDEALDAWLLEYTVTSHHISCTCKMGPAEDPMAVVDQHGKIHGLQNIRVADASIMPNASGTTPTPPPS